MLPCHVDRLFFVKPAHSVLQIFPGQNSVLRHFQKLHEKRLRRVSHLYCGVDFQSMSVGGFKILRISLESSLTNSSLNAPIKSLVAIAGSALKRQRDDAGKVFVTNDDEAADMLKQGAGASSDEKTRSTSHFLKNKSD